VVSNQIALVVVLTIARGVGVGAVSAYQYAFIFFQLPYGLVAVSLMTAVLPELATAAQDGDDQRFAERFHEGLGLLVTFMLPAAGAYLFIGRPVVELLLQRGEFDAAPPPRRCSSGSAWVCRRSRCSCTACGRSTRDATRARRSS
jgi:putative peptidoglycan lipid II flippase